jgi:hypothetical protein
MPSLSGIRMANKLRIRHVPNVSNKLVDTRIVRKRITIAQHITYTLPPNDVTGQ